MWWGRAGGQKDNLDLLDSCDLKRIRKGGLDIRTRSMKVVGGVETGGVGGNFACRRGKEIIG